MQHQSLEDILAQRAEEPVPAEVAAMAEAVKALFGDGAAAILAYGSSLRGVDPSETLIDLYVLVGSLSDVSSNPVSRAACGLLPPNVYYAETVFEGRPLRAKYAVLPLDSFERRCSGATDNPYFWARFSQPCRLIYVRDRAVRFRVIQSLGEAVRTMLTAAAGIEPAQRDVSAIWAAGFRETYRTELRPEGPDRAAGIVAADEVYYRALAEAAAPVLPERSADWRLRRFVGKALSVLRLMKAAFTFAGGADYLAWKIARHSGERIELKPWQRRHPILGALSLLPGLLRRGSVR